MTKLFSALRVGQLELSHRLVTTVHSTSRLTAADYRRRATAGGLIVADGCPAHDFDMDGWTRVTNGIHEVGGLVVALLGLGTQHERAESVEVDALMEHVQRTARLASAAGFDGVELDAAAGSLPERFLQPQTNSRDDDYGGDDARRMRFLIEAAHVAAQECSIERIGVRLSPRTRPGQTDLFAGVMRALSEHELAYVHFAHAGAQPPSPPGCIAAGTQRQAFRTDLSCVLIASDDCDVDAAASAVESRWADAVGFLQTNGDPDFIVRLLQHEQ